MLDYLKANRKKGVVWPAGRTIWTLESTTDPEVFIANGVAVLTEDSVAHLGAVERPRGLSISGHTILGCAAASLVAVEPI